MNLLELLKQFKTIEPDPAFSEMSRRAVLAFPPAAPKRLTAWRMAIRLVETGAALALTGFFMLLLVGGLSGSKFAPVQYSAIDPNGLRAEAQAIDIQIQLANVNYHESPAQAESTFAAPKAAGILSVPAMGAPKTAGITTEASSTATTTPVSIDAALQGLSN